MLKSGSCRQFIPIRIKVYSSEGRGARGSRGGGGKYARYATYAAYSGMQSFFITLEMQMEEGK